MRRDLAGCGAALMALLVLAPLQAGLLVDCPPPLRAQIDADIIYASEPPFRLSTYLKQLLEGL